MSRSSGTGRPEFGRGVALALGLCLLAGRPCAAAGPVPAEPVGWTDEAGRSFSFREGHGGRRLVVTLAYTSCRMTCPMTMRRLREIQRALERKAVAAEFVFVTVDPRVDTPARLATFKRAWNAPASWHFVRASADETRKLSEALGIHFDEIGGHLRHDSKIVLLDPSGRLERVIEEPESAAEPLSSG